MLTISREQKSLTDAQLKTLHEMWLRCMLRIIASTTLAGSGHPGGSMSSLHLLLLLYGTMQHRRDDPCWPERDRLLVSMGHISPAVYSVLCEFGYIREEDILLEFRRAGSSFPGHVECCVPGVEWNTGNLGQGLSAGAGMALGMKLRNKPARMAVLMGDGEQQKGQIAEARRFAAKYELNNLFGVIDRNRRQIGGDTNEVMPQAIGAEYAAAKWNVLRVEDGHDFEQIFQALSRIYSGDVDNPLHPSVIVARTIMGKGVSFMEGKAKYHGSTLSMEMAGEALKELGLDNPLEGYREKRKAPRTFKENCTLAPDHSEVVEGEPRTYPADAKVDNRSAYGNALEDLARVNNTGAVPRILGFSCDLEDSVKMGGFHKASPNAFFETGIQEHHAATLAGAAGKEGFAAFFSTFGVFGVCETYNQHRLNDMNGTNLKLVCTHVGLDVGEDGQTHQCIDYLGLLQNLFNFSIFMPADPNQTDRVVRYAAAHWGNFFVGMGRSKAPVITNEANEPFFGGSYRFEPGKADWIRRGRQGALLSHGVTTAFAVEAQKQLAEKHGIEVAVVNFGSIKPLDADAVLEAAKTGFILTVEDHHADTGLGARVATVLADTGTSVKLVRLGVRRYGYSGGAAALFHSECIDVEGIVKTVREASAAGCLKEI